jgi:hypothetical protein
MKLLDKLNKLKKSEEYDFGMSEIMNNKPADQSDTTLPEEQSDKALADMINSIPVSPENTAPESHSSNIKDPVQSSAAQQSPTSPHYGIQETIELINSLPSVDPELMMPVVIKTLESAKINVNDIITDAAQREEIIETRSMDLINNIETLEAKIAELNDEVMALNTELEDIANVKNLLLSSLLEEDEITEDETPAKAHSAEDTSKKNPQSDRKPETDDLLDADFDDLDIEEALDRVNNIHVVQKA